MCPADSSPTRAICYTFPKKGNDTPLTFQMAEDLTQRPATVPKGREETEDDAYDDSAWIECL